jgi:DNA polymerase
LVRTKEKLRGLFDGISAAATASPEFADETLVFSTGSASCPVMVVGEAPGRNEVAEGKPFVGKAGAFLLSILEEVFESGRDGFYITNVVKLWPHIKTKRLKTRPPSKAELAFFTPYLLKEIEIVDPRVIIAVGKTAFTAVAADIDARFVPGLWIDGVRDVMPVYHPAYILRRARSINEMTRDLKAALGLVVERLKAPQSPRGAGLHTGQ